MRVITGYFEHYPQHSNRQPKQRTKQPYPSLLVALYHRFWQGMTQLLIGSAEPYVWQVRDRCGEQCWHVYDPVTNRSGIFASEEEVRMWLEKRYYC